MDLSRMAINSNPNPNWSLRGTNSLSTAIGYLMKIRLKRSISRPDPHPDSNLVMTSQDVFEYAAKPIVEQVCRRVRVGAIG